MSSSDMCRVCAKLINFTSSALNLFNRSKRKLLEQIKQLTGLVLKNEHNLPKLICKDCQMDLQLAILFRDRCIKTQEQYLSTHKFNGKRNTKNIRKAAKNKRYCEIEEVIVEPPMEKEYVAKEDSLCSDTEVLSTRDEVSVESLEENHSESEYKDFLCFKNGKRRIEVEVNESKIMKTADGSTIEVQADEILKGKLTKGKSKEDKNEFICDQCGNHFFLKHHFLTHLRRHAGDKQFQCEICMSKFFTHSELNRHMRRHTGERPFPCKHCGRRFTDYSTRIKHERTHTNERPFSCSHCGKAFTTSYILKNHMLIHTGERFFKCELCNKSFQRQTHLVVHYRSLMHRQNEEKKPTLTETLVEPKNDIINSDTTLVVT